MNNSFRADIYINDKGQLQGKVYNLELNEEYTNFRIEDAVGEFVNTVKEEYIEILDDIAKDVLKSNILHMNKQTE